MPERKPHQLVFSCEVGKIEMELPLSPSSGGRDVWFPIYCGVTVAQKDTVLKRRECKGKARGRSVYVITHRSWRSRALGLRKGSRSQVGRVPRMHPRMQALLTSGIVSYL